MFLEGLTTRDYDRLAATLHPEACDSGAPAAGTVRVARPSRSR